jgi:hypothetical protein
MWVRITLDKDNKERMSMWTRITLDKDNKVSVGKDNFG